MKHTPVLLKEIVDILDPKPGQVLVDATVGAGGHSKALCQKADGNLTIVGMDADPRSLEVARDNLKDSSCQIHLARSNFREIDKVLVSIGIVQVSAFLFDLGLSSMQLNSERGFSFKGGQLLMNFSEEDTKLKAKDIINEWSQEDIENVLIAYGNERYADRISKAIVEDRKLKPITEVSRLREIIRNAVPSSYRARKIDPATKTFQALRVAVNDEIGALEEGLGKATDYLKRDGKLAVISFHSLEDKTVKSFFKKLERRDVGKRFNKKVIKPTAEEIKKNPRARSAKLRVFVKN